MRSLPLLADGLVSRAFGFAHALPQRVRLVLLTGYVTIEVEKMNDKRLQIHLLYQWDCLYIKLDTDPRTRVSDSFRESTCDTAQFRHYKI